MTKRLPTIEDRISLERLNGGDHYGSLVAYASNKTGGVVVKDIASGEEKLIEAKAAGSAKFAPDGKSFLYLAAAETGGRQLFIRELESDSSKRVTDFKGPIIDPIWSPDGKRILFASINGAASGEKKTRQDEAIVIEDFGYKSDGRGFIRPSEHMHLFVTDLDGNVTALTGGTDDYLQHNWVPDSRGVVCISAKARKSDETLGFDLYLIDADEPEKEPVQISHGLNLVSYPNPMRPVLSPDGKSVYMGVMDPDSDIKNGYPEIYFYRIPTDGAEAERIFLPDENCFQCVEFPYNAGCGTGFDRVRLSEDGQSIYFVAGFKGQCAVYRLNVNGDGHAEKLLSGDTVRHGLGAIRDGKMLVACSRSDTPEFYSLFDTVSGELTDGVVCSNKELTETAAFSPVSDFFFKTLDGESEVHGFAMPPQNAEPGKKYPAVLYIHGGPHPFYTYGFTMEHQCLAAEGLGVIFCNPRGSSGYGMKHQNVKRATDGSAYTDCLQFVDEACRRFDWIDADRIGVTGGSYGGYMTNYIATHSERFKAYVSQRSVVNDLIGYASSDMQCSSKEYKSFEEFMVNSLKSSPVSYAERVNKPFLILHGMEDLRTPVYGAHQLYTALKDLHPELPVRMVLFPHVAHDQPSDHGQLRIYFEELAGWFKKYL